MSAQILRQARFALAACSSSPVRIAPRRCYSALVAARLQDDPHNLTAGPSHDAFGASAVDPPPENNHTGAPLSVLVEEVEEGEKPPNITRSSRNSKNGKKSAPSDTARTSRVEAYLASIHAAGIEPTLADLERCRPADHAHSSSPRYPVDYNALVDTLCRSFSKEQLRKFLQQWNPNCVWCRPNRRKLQYAEWIIEKMWNWPSLKDVERAKRDRTEVSVKSIPVTASQLFLILGRDGADLLEMSLEYNVHISLATHPLALRVEGLRGALSKLSDHLTKVKRSIIEEVFQLPTKIPIRPDMVQRISRLAEAYLENIGTEGMVRICAKNVRNLEIAKRLVSRASHELSHRSQPARLAYLPSPQAEFPVPITMFPNTYSLYPFLSPRSLPWTMNMGSAFRVRRVGEWLSHKLGEDIHVTGGLARGNGRILTATQSIVDLSDALFQKLPPNPPGQVVKASMGHILLNASSPAQRATLVPPLRGNRRFSDILTWIANNNVQSSFVPSLPAPLVSSSPTQQKIIHRLTYRALPALGEASNVVSPGFSNRVLYFEVTLDQPRPLTKSSSLPEEGATVQLDPTESQAGDDMLFDLNSPPECWVGSEVLTDLMMPDRPMDIRFAAVQSSYIPTGEEPIELRTYMTNLCTFLAGKDLDARQPDPPFMLRFGPDLFMLNTNTSVRQSVDLITIPGPASQPQDSSQSIRVVNESILDLESNQKSTHCEITCDDRTSQDDWRRFLHDCDRLSSATYRPIGSVTLQQTDNEDLS
ncbi:uncharacterized protein FIBRA_00998 [Fibroporia radiculosa]|uniref:Uncharacterized protein n=1 Tax=Fibroporia radiculosa TaxID=599839 RepID=J4GJ37_9APHY|nr:uncharacterized protein FIBRA_00998 [Fibroporia radiculosa]CCL98990.1 predicted protein [Fibroporia radiculosa]